MSTHKHFDKLCYAVLAVTLIITILFMNGKSLGLSTTENEDASNDMFTANDLNSNWDTSSAHTIILSDEGNTVTGNGAYILDSDIYIVNSGQYVISGELSNGSIIINADSNDKIWLMLNGASIHCDDDAAIRVEQAGKVFLTLADATENTVSTGSQYDEDIISSGVDGAIYSRDDLTISGNGLLNVAAKYMHGIVCNDDLVITGGTITIDAVQDGIHANDSVRITNTDINVSAGDDGITVSNDDETAFMYIESGNINISSCYEGLEAIDITIDGGTIHICAEDDGINANGSGENSVIRITGGDITILNPDGRDADGLDSNKDIYISGGNLLISLTNDGSNSAIDYGTENGGICEISAGTVIACGSSGMAEGFDSSSEQGFIMHTASAQAGTTVILEDSDGNELISSEIPYSFSSVIVSTPEMEVGDTCTLIIGETKEKITIDNSSVSSSFGFGKGAMNDIDRGGRFSENFNSSDQESKENQNKVPSDSQPLSDMQTPPDEKNANTDSDNFQPQMSEDFDSERQENMPKDFEDENFPADMPHKNEDTGEKMTNEAENGITDDETNFDDSNIPFGQDRRDFNDNQGEQLLSDNSQSAVLEETVIYVAVSIGVLILGCLTAIIIKRKK